MSNLAYALCAALGDDDPPPRALSARRGSDNATRGAASTDAALIASLRAGDSNAFRALVVQHYASLVRFAAGMLGDRDAADDVVQETLGRVWDQRLTLTVHGSLRAYLYGAVRNRSLNVIAYDAVRTHAAPLLRAEHESHVAPADNPDDTDVTALRSALATLSERRQTALRLRYEEGLTYPEIGIVMRISTNSAEQLVFHAIRALRVVLGVSPA